MNRRSLLQAAFFAIAGFPLSIALAADPLPQGLPFPDAALDRTFDCSRIKELGIDKQTNMHATLRRIQCGVEPRPEIPAVNQGEPYIQRLSPSAYGGGDVNTITGAESYPAVTQSESFVWAQGTTVVTTFNDSRTAPGNYSGGAYSTDGGTTFTRLTPSPFASGHGTNYGDPTVVFDVKLNTWYASFLATGCGGQGIGIWTSPDGITWSTGACAHSGGADDRQSMWVDNNAASPFYGRMYISWNDFGAGQGIYCVRSDDGTTWTTVTVFASFQRNVQLSGSPGTDGTVFIAAMDEGGGGLSPRTNIIYRSTDGGVSWTGITMGAAFAAPGSVSCGYFEAITPIWRHMGWGQPGVGPSQVVHYPYCGAGAAGDNGDIYYTRSTDNGSTWSAAIRLNTDAGTREQWMPSVSVTVGGTVFAGWYDRRSTSGDSYEYWGRLSTDNGATWQSDQVISDVVSPQPLQPDPNVQGCYVGDYNYHSANGNTHYVTWCDGRVQVSGNNQQDVWFDKVTVSSCPTITLAPATLPNGSIGVPYSQTITASGGTAPYTFAVTAGTLPAGLTLTPAGVLSGTPTTAGSSTFTVTATDANTCTGSLQYTIVISCPTITLAPGTLPNGTTGVAYSQTITASGGAAPYTFSVTAGAPPTGLTLTPAGILSGTPTAAGSFTFTVTATDANTCTGSLQYTIVISCPTITLAPGTLPNGTTGVAYSQTITASGGTAPYTFTATGTLPTGLTLTPAGIIAGTPTAAGTFNFTVTATDANACTGSQAYGIVVSCPTITVNPATLPNGQVGTAYSQTLTATGGTAPYTFALSAGALPPGLTLSAAGILSGTPTTTGTYNFTARATDVNGCTGTRAYTIVINPACGTITLAPAALPNAEVNQAYSQTITASGGIAPYTYAISAGALPAGLTLSAGGVLSGTATIPGTYNFTVTATDSTACFGSRAYTLNVIVPANPVVGQGLGAPNSPRVRVYTRVGATTAVDFLAYGINQWGVNVAAGDIDGAFYDEIITGPGPGPGMGPQVRAFDRAGVPNSKVSFYAYGTLKNGVNISAGNMDADAFDEILTGAGPGVPFGPHVRGWNFDNLTLTSIGRISYYAYVTLQYGVNVDGGNVDSDAYGEMITGPGPGVTLAPQVRGYNYDGATVTAINKINFNAFALTGYGVRVAAGDVDADSYAEILATPGPGASFSSRFLGFNYDGATLTSLPGYDVTPYTSFYGGDLGAGDMTVPSNGRDELLAGAGRDPAANSTVRSYSYSGTALTLMPNAFIPFGTSTYGVIVAGGKLGY